MNDSEIRIYHISPLRRSLLAIVVGPIILVMLLFGLYFFNSSEGKASLATAGLIFLIMLPFQWLLYRTKLTVSAAGVSLKQTGGTLQAPWNEIIRIRIDKGREGFVTSVPMTGSGAELFARFRGIGQRGSAATYDDEQRALLEERRFIPIEAFGWYLRRGTLFDDIVRFAPQLSKDLEPLGRSRK